MTNYFTIDEVVVDYLQQLKVTLKLFPSSYEALLELKTLIYSGKIQITGYKEKEVSEAEKLRQQTVEINIKDIYAEIEKTVNKHNFSLITFLCNMSAKSLDEIVKEFTNKGFVVDNKIDYLKISWK